MFKIRYNLQRGKNYKFWQLVDIKNKNISYIKPEDCVIKLHNCILENNRKISDKIYLGSNKIVCAWIKFKDIEVFDKSEIVPSWCQQIRYNPRVLPYWHTAKNSPQYPENFVNLDGLSFDELYLSEKGVFYNSCRQNITRPYPL